jgi:putative endonuclease
VEPAGAPPAGSIAPAGAAAAQAFGRSAESLAAEHLSHLGYRILERNYRFRGGELDLVAIDGDTLVFVEVRARRSIALGTPFETVNRRKQRQVARAAEHWLVGRGLERAPARFDVVSVVCPAGETPRIEVIRNAFEVT